MILHDTSPVAATPPSAPIASITARASSAPGTVRRMLFGVVLVSGLGIVLGCAATPPCRQGAKGDVVLGARTAGQAVKTGAETGVEGVKTAGRTVGGWVEGGSKEAKEEWKEGKQETKETAHDGAADVRREATVPECGK
jgi:hypothetical protein